MDQHVPEQNLVRAFAQQDLSVYAVTMWPQYQIAPHIQMLVDTLQRVESGELKRVIIAMPPRHSKSETVSKVFPAWYLGRHPNHFVIAISYGEDLATDFGRAVRNYISSPQHREIFPECRLADDSTSVHRFHTTRRGVYYAVGRGGPITGRGAHLIIIDDPLKDRVEANSDLVRQQMQDWYKTVVYTRLMKGGAVVVVSTRWHVDDLSGWLLREHAKQGWFVLDLAARAEPDDALGREQGAPLWPEFFDDKVLTEIEEQLGPEDWLAMYQQKPVVGGGYMFKREDLRFYEQRKDQHKAYNRYILVDSANSKKKGSDFTAFFVVGLAPDNNIYVLDMVRDRLNLKERSDILFNLHRKWKPQRVGYERYGLQADVPAFKERMDRDNYRFEIVELGGQVKKFERIRRLQFVTRQNRLYFPYELWYTTLSGEQINLVDYFINKEYCLYPAVKLDHDDCLDALARIEDPDLQAYYPMTYEEDTRSWLKRKRRSWMAA